VEKPKEKSKKMNVRVVLYSFIALIFMWLTFTVDWIFIVGALFMIYLNKKELYKE